MGNTIAFSQPVAEPGKTSRGAMWTGRVLTTLVVLFMAFDAVGKFMMPKQVVAATARLGVPASLCFTLGVLLSIATVVYANPRTAFLGAVILTGYLGGAVAIQLRAGSPAFECVFPVLFAVIAWAGVVLRAVLLHRA
jgi:hypothetical protein